MSNVAKLFLSAVKEVPEKKALIINADLSLSWFELYCYAQNLVNKLNVVGVNRNDRIGIYIPHCSEQVVAILAVFLADSVFTIISSTLKIDQIKHQICDSDIRGLLVDGDISNELSSLLSYRQIDIITVEKITGPPTVLTNVINDVTKSIPTDVACIIYTSGSTGNPKGIVVPHRTLLDGARIVSGYLGITEDDILLSILPLGFDYGLNQLLSVIYKKAKIKISDSNLPNDIFSQIHEYGITGFAAVPSMWVHFFNKKYFDSKNTNLLDSLRYVTTAGGKHSEDLLINLQELFPQTEIIIMYGLTESFRSAYLPASEVFKRIGSIGKAVPEVELLVLNENGQECKPGEKGELYHRGAFVNYGYLNNEELTKRRFIKLRTGGVGCRDEYIVRSGDLVSKDEEGYIYFHERIDTQIKCSGYRISPNQVEEIALMIPDIKSVAVVGVEDYELGQVVGLVYSTYSGEETMKQEMNRVFNKNLPSYAVPRHVHFLNDLPVTGHGKLDYQKIKSHVLGLS